MAGEFELVRRIGGGRFAIRNAFGEFHATSLSSESAFDLAVRNIPADVADNLYSVSDTAPLLAESAVGYGSIGTIGGGAVAAAPALGEVGIGVGIGVASTGAGLAIGLSGGATLPGHKNIGPGNDPDPEGVDVDDNIAYTHDIRYGSAVDQEDIVEADIDAIADFDKDFQDTGNIHSVIGRTGLQVKKAVESYTGVLYPPNLPPRSIPGK